MDMPLLIDWIYDVGADEDRWRELGRTMASIFGVEKVSLVAIDDGRCKDLFEQSAAKANPISEQPSHTANERLVHFRCGAGSVNEWVVGTSDNDIDAKLRFVVPALHAPDDDWHDAISELLPHLARAVRLRRRLQQAALNARLAAAACGALPGSAIIVDVDLNILFANTSARRQLVEKGSPIGLNPPNGARGERLTIFCRANAARIKSMISDAASGAAGGAIRLDTYSDTDHGRQFALIVSPQPTEGHDNSFAGSVIVVLTELSRPSIPQASLLADIFGLSIAEGAVALALMGGHTAERVAVDRLVSLETVRSQVRTVLRKTQAANLRDFERMGALIGAMVR